MAIGSVANHPHVYPVTTADILSDDAGRAAEEVLWSTPSGRIADVLVGGVGTIAILEDEVPKVLWRKEEDLRSSAVACADRSLVKVVECGRVGLSEIAEAKVDEVITCRDCCAGEDMIEAVVVDNRGVFDPSYVPAIVLRTDKHTARAPFETTGQIGRWDQPGRNIGLGRIAPADRFITGK